MSDDGRETSRLTLDDNRTPYNDVEFVGFVTDLYELLIKLAYLSRDQITWPPSGGHAINEGLCRELQIEPGAVSLIERLPYVGGDFRYSIHLTPQSEPLSYLQDDDMERSRDPDGEPPRLRRDYIFARDIPLTVPADGGSYLVMDVKYSKSLVFVEVLAMKADTVSDTFREVPWDEDPEDRNPDGWELERPDDLR